LFDAATLLARVDTCRQAALASGALLPVATTASAIEDGGVRFVVRVVANLARKVEAARAPASGPPANPFLPFDRRLFVADLSADHVCILNKFNVVERHLLIVTRAYEDQENLVTETDFLALARCLDAIDGLGFYNGGRMAGASQPHKHLQVVPLPLAPVSAGVPIAAVFGDRSAIGVVRFCERLPFRHALVWLPPWSCADEAGRASIMTIAYRRLCQAIGVHTVNRNSGQFQSAAYNLLVTREWMLAVARRCESVEGVEVNALGYAGSLFVRDEAALQTLHALGPMRLITQAALD
jgi:ATP adenylyltransferase